MRDRQNGASEETNNGLQGYVENSIGQPKPVDNDGVSAGEMIENAEAAAATTEHEENIVDSSLPPASAEYVNDHHSSDDENLPRSINTQLHATDEAKTQMNLEGARNCSRNAINKSVIYFFRYIF